MLSVVAAGTEPISYQWYVGGQALAGATGSSLSLANVEAVNSGDYQVIVSNHAGTESSDTVTLTVESPPVITELTGSLSAVEGDTVALSVTAVGTAPLAYRWSKGGVVLDGATGSTLTLANVAPSDADNYMVAVSNGAGRVESESITVTVVQPASIVSQPEGGQATLGDSFVLSVAATGTEPLSYQWYHDGELITGANLASMTLADLGAVDTGTYQVVVQNFAGTATSDEVSLSVETPPAITQQPGSRDAAVGSDIVLSITAIGSEPLAYQWSRDGVVLPGATGAELALTGLEPSDAGSYTVSISWIVMQRWSMSSNRSSSLSNPAEVSRFWERPLRSPSLLLVLSRSATNGCTTESLWREQMRMPSCWQTCPPWTPANTRFGSPTRPAKC